MKILLVDDSELMLSYLASLLRKHKTAGPLELRSAKSATEALEACAQELPDAILMDFVLEPGRTGLEVLSAILALSKGAKAPRLAILTQGKLANIDEQRALGLGARVLQKPLRGQEAAFLERIDEWLTS
ncbi:MAG: response regulator [Deltaproteobacteria bacterium]|nr:response regulator [Deltaproteobacteria bacterium]